METATVKRDIAFLGKTTTMHCRPHHVVRSPYICLVAALVFTVLYLYNKTAQQATVAVASATSSFDLESDAAGLTDRVAAQGMDGSITLDKDKEEYSTVDTLLFFVGYPRSRHTLLSSLLDGHPHIVLGNEANMFYRLAHGNLMTRNAMFDILTRSSRNFLKIGGKGIVMKGTVNDTKHFGFFMQGYWQGTYDKYIKVIGDKTAWITSGTFRNLGFDKASQLVKKLEETYNVKTKFIHIIRNPFDIISTSTVRDSKQTKRFGNHSFQISEPDLLERGMERFFNWAKGSAIAREALGDKLLDVVGLELVRRPAETMRKICDFIEITCSEDYIQACAEVVDPNPSITRNYVVWTKEQKNRVYSEIEQYPFLADYTFDD